MHTIMQINQFKTFKEKRRINAILKYHNLVTVRNGKYSNKELSRRLAYERLFFCPNFH